MVISYIALGSNLGDRSHYIQTALRKIRQIPSTKVRRVSTLIISEPEGGPPGQGSYLNGVAEIETELFPYQLLSELQKIETELGRIRTVSCAPRTIDIDILSYGEAVITEEALVVPHPRMFVRAFVSGPLEEIAPGMMMKLKRLKRKKASRNKK